MPLDDHKSNNFNELCWKMPLLSHYNDNENVIKNMTQPQF